eukprot:scaffold642991_cov17-Prasinocladus_malaysianus.AAC.1
MLSLRCRGSPKATSASCAGGGPPLKGPWGAVSSSKTSESSTVFTAISSRPTHMTIGCPRPYVSAKEPA